MSFLTSYEPRQIRSLMDELFTEGTGWSPRPLSGLYPAVEVREKKDHFELTAELPGMEKEDIRIEVKNGVLTLTGEKKHEVKEDKEGYHYSERSYGRFQREFNLGERVNPDSVEAEYKNGILRVTLGKNHEKESKQIAVK